MVAKLFTHQSKTLIRMDSLRFVCEDIVGITIDNSTLQSHPLRVSAPNLGGHGLFLAGADHQVQHLRLNRRHGSLLVRRIFSGASRFPLREILYNQNRTKMAVLAGALSFYELSALDIDGNMFNFSDLKGKVRWPPAFCQSKL